MRTIVNADRQVFRNHDTTARAFLRRTPGVDEQTRPTSLCRFVLRVLHELTPGHVRDAAIDDAVSVGLHIPNVQVLEDQQAIAIDQLARFLVRKVVASIRLALIGVTQGVRRLAPFGATLGQAFLLALQAGDVLGISLHPTLARDGFAIGHHRERGEAKVDADHLLRDGQGLGFHDAREAGIPVSYGVPADGQGLGLALDGSVHLDLDGANLGETQAAIGKETPVAFLLRICERIIAVFAAKAGIAGLVAVLDAMKERLEGKVHAQLCVLLRLSVPASQRLIVAAPLSEQAVGIVQ